MHLLLLGDLLLLLLNQLAGLFNSHAEVFVVLQDNLDLLDVQVNEHTGDLGGFVILELLDEIENGGTNLVLVVWVISLDGLDERAASHQIGFLDRNLLNRLLLGGEASYVVLLNRHLLHRLHLTLHNLGVLACRSHVVDGLLATGLTVLELLAFVAHVTLLALVLCILVVTTLGRSLTRLVLTNSWHLLEELLEHLKESLGFVGQGGLLEPVLFAEVNKVDLVLVILVLDLADFLDFVVVNLERAALEVDVVELTYGLGSGIGS